MIKIAYQRWKTSLCSGKKLLTREKLLFCVNNLQKSFILITTKKQRLLVLPDFSVSDLPLPTPGSPNPNSDLLNIVCPCRELKEQPLASQSLSCQLCLMMSWITRSEQGWRSRGNAVTHYGKQLHPPSTHALLIWWILSSQIGHKFWTWSRKSQEKGEKQRDKFVQGDGANNDEHVRKERWIEREKY